jgi:PD-(D/E)XK endonuclease
VCFQDSTEQFFTPAISDTAMDVPVRHFRNSKSVGDITQSQVMAALLKRGKKVLMPFGDNFRYDLVVEDDGRFTRIQCKTGKINRGAIAFSVASSQYHRGGKRQNYRGQVDAFGVFCPDNDKVYIIPIDDLPLVREAKLRLTLPRNSQVKGVRWASVYEI